MNNCTNMTIKKNIRQLSYKEKTNNGVNKGQTQQAWGNILLHANSMNIQVFGQSLEKGRYVILLNIYMYVNTTFCKHLTYDKMQ